MIAIFNSLFEISLRILMILYVTQDRMSMDRIVAMDFIAVYGKDFGVSKNNLHGENNYRFSEYAARRHIMSQAIKELVIRNYIVPHVNKKGFCYSISDVGKLFCESLNDEYANVYKSNLESANTLFLNYSDRKIMQCINQYAVGMFGGDAK